MGVRYCSGLNCSSNSKWNKDLSFFRFPKDPKRLKQWMQAYKKKDIYHADADYAYKNLMLCSKHFSDSCFMNALEKKNLVWDAVPTLFDVPNPPPCRYPKRKAPKTRGVPPPPKKRKIASHDEREASGKIICREDCGCDKCLTKEEQRKKAELTTATARGAGPIQRQIVTTKSGLKKKIMIVKKAFLKNLQAKGLIQPINKCVGKNPSSLQPLKSDIIPVASVSADNPSNESEDSLHLKGVQSTTKSSSFPAQLNTDENYKEEDSNTDSMEEPVVSIHATQTHDHLATKIPPPCTTQTSFPHATQIPQATEIPNPQAIKIPNPQTTKIPNPQATQNPNPQATKTPNPQATQNPNPQSVNQGNQAPVTVSWVPVNGSNELSFTFTVKLPEGVNTLSGISHDSLQKATSLLNNSTPCIVSQSNLQARDHLEPNQISKSHSSSNSGISPNQRIKGSTRLASAHSITPYQDSLQIGASAVSSKPLHPSPVVRKHVLRKRIHTDRDTRSSKTTTTTKDTSTATITPKHVNHHPPRVTLPDISYEESCEETNIDCCDSPEESTIKDEQPSEIKPKKIQGTALPPASPIPPKSPSPGLPEPKYKPNLTGIHQVPNTTLHSSKMLSITSHIQNTVYKAANKELKRKYSLLLRKHRRRYDSLLKKYRLLEKKYSVIEDVGTPEQILRDARTFLSEEHILFFESQMFLRNRHGKGNRFSREFMQLMLKYYSRSGAGYRFLRTLFTIPSVQTVQNWLAKELESRDLDDEGPGGSKEHSGSGNDEKTNPSQKKSEKSCQDENPSTTNVSSHIVESKENSANHCDAEESSREGMEIVEGQPTC